MLFRYKVLDQTGAEHQGSVEAINEDVAIASLQRKGYIITSIIAAEKKPFLNLQSYFEHVSYKEIVILSRQISTLFEAQVSALRVFRLLGTETQNQVLQKTLTKIADDLQGGMSISNALMKHPNVFSSFYVSMVRAGEETGRLDQTFSYLADYLDRSYELTSKAKHALVYPAFVIVTFIGVMVLMMTLVVPRISGILLESGGQVPIYTLVILKTSQFFVDFGVFLFIGLAVIIVFLVRWLRTDAGKTYFDGLKLKIPFIGTLYRKLYLARISDNLSTMLSSGIAMIRALEITADLVENVHYERAIRQSITDIKNGAAVSKAFAQHPDEMPGIMVQMIKVGEETGELGNILKTLAFFYQREVSTAVDTLVGLIEPAMIVLLGGGVGLLLAAILLPIYSITTSIA